MENQTKIKLDASIAGPLFMLSSALLFTGLNIIIKLLGPEYNVWHIAFFRFFGGVIVLIVMFGRRTNPYRSVNTRLLIIRGFVGSVAFISLITAIRILPVSTALVIFYTFPVFSAIAAFVIFRETIGKIEMFCMAVVLSGVALLLDFQLTTSLLGQTFALIAGVFAGITVTLVRSLRKTNGPVIIYLYFCTMGAIISAPMFIMDPILPATSVEWVMILGIVFASVSAQLLMNQGFFYCRGWEGGVFMSSEVLFTAIIGIVFLGDPASWKFWCGGLMIFGSVVVLNRLKAEKRQDHKIEI